MAPCCPDSKHYDNFFSQYKGGKHPSPLYSHYQSGSGFTPFIGIKYPPANIQQGKGIGSLLGGLFRTIVPLVKPAFQTVKALAKPITKQVVGRTLKKVAKRAGQELLKGGIEIAQDTLKGKKLKTSVQNQTQKLQRQALQAVKRNITKQLLPVVKGATPSPPKKKKTQQPSKKKRTRAPRQKKRRLKDIFD